MDGACRQSDRGLGDRRTGIVAEHSQPRRLPILSTQRNREQSDGNCNGTSGDHVSIIPAKRVIGSQTLNHSIVCLQGMCRGPAPQRHEPDTGEVCYSYVFDWLDRARLVSGPCGPNVRLSTSIEEEYNCVEYRICRPGDHGRPHVPELAEVGPPTGGL